ncbi:hypothetical protein [Flavobacterium sp.]|uniref:hypothetical protein n=1 Tax=Flavobacterium sp. TaxID=239 RepID=UPI00260EB1FC|nr:hypothetical protein [Flavobacterium sp.]
MPNKKQLTWASFAIAIMFTALTGCTNDDTQATDKSTAGKNALAALREATGISGTNTISIPAHPGTAMRNADGSYELTDFIIDMDYIKQTIVDEKITYSFSIMPKVVTSKNDFNLIVYNNGTGWEYSIMELVHDPTVAAVDPDNFKGTMKELYSSTARGTGCTTIFAEYHHCTHTGPCADGTCDGCSLCVDYKSFRLCSLDSEAYLTAVLIETPNNGGGGSTEITVTPGGFIFDPNVKVSDALTIRKERSIAFYNNLSTEQQQWAQTHEDSYLSLLNYLLDHFTTDNDLKISDLVALAAANNVNLIVDSSVTAQNALNFNTVEEFQNYLDDEQPTPTEEYEFDETQVMAMTKVKLNQTTDIAINVKQRLDPYAVLNVTTSLSGLTLFDTWTQLDYSVDDSTEHVKIRLIGTSSKKVFVEGLGTYCEKPIDIEIRIEKSTGRIYATICHY